MSNSNDNNITNIVILLSMLILVILAVISIQGFRNIKNKKTDKETEVQFVDRDYKLIDLDSRDYIVEYNEDKYEYLYSDTTINYLGSIDDIMYFVDSSTLFVVDSDHKFSRTELLKFDKYKIDDGYIYNNKLYFLDDNSVYSLDLNNINNERILVVDEGITKMYLDNGIIYYIDRDNDLFKYNIVNNDKELIYSNVNDIKYIDGFIIMIRNESLNIYNTFDGKNNMISYVDYNRLNNNVEYYQGIVYYLNNGSIYSYVNSNSSIYFEDGDIMNFKVLSSSVIRVSYESTIRYLNKKELVTNNPLESYEFVYNNNSVKFTSDCIKK